MSPNTTQQKMLHRARPTLDDLLLQREVEQLYTLEAQLLDGHEYNEWLELYAPDARYWAPLRMNRTRRDLDKAVTARGDVAYFEETYDSLVWRVRRFGSGVAWSEDPPSRNRHLITNVSVEPASPEDVFEGKEGFEHYVARSNFYSWKNRLERESDFIVGARRDVLRRVDDMLFICDRTIYIDYNVLPAKNISTFL